MKREIGGARTFHSSTIDAEDHERNRRPYILSCTAKFLSDAPKVLTRSLL